ncbi:MAG: PadR family transcriptional regulator [Chloroflexi bacterium HGW-Chloroflexi-9]|nr:MAG: PadR family transcriptional regulator [Chloroflexi bacterium HGW-Chloroflexi-9]
MADTIFREFFLGFIRVHILHHAAREGVYGLGMIEELARHGYDLSPGTMYPLLHTMERNGYLTREDRHVNGRPRKYYVITEFGREVLAEARVKIAELTGSASTRGPGRSSATGSEAPPRPATRRAARR